MSNNNKSNNNNNTCPLWNAWALKYCFISNHFASLGRVIWDPLQCTWKQGSVFCFNASSRFTICSALKSQELKAIKIKRFSSLQRATQASATYQPFRQQLFLFPILHAVSLQQVERQHHMPRTRSLSPTSRGTGTAVTTPVCAACSTNPGKMFYCAQNPFTLLPVSEDLFIK